MYISCYLKLIFLTIYEGSLLFPIFKYLPPAMIPSLQHNNWFPPRLFSSPNKHNVVLSSLEKIKLPSTPHPHTSVSLHIKTFVKSCLKSLITLNFHSLFNLLKCYSSHGGPPNNPYKESKTSLLQNSEPLASSFLTSEQ